MRFLRNPAVVIVAAVALAVIVIGTFVVVRSSPSKPASNSVSTQAPAPAVTPMAVYQPPSAKDVAGSLNCRRFKDLGPDEVGESIDSGSCWIGRVKYAINTFASKPVRDAWLQAAEPLGVVPKWETDTSVTYPSVSL